MSEPLRPARSSAADQELALNVAAAVRTAAYFEADNSVMQQVCSALAAQLGERAEREGFVRIGVHSHNVFVGAGRIRSSVLTYERFAYLTQMFARWGINALTFHAGVTESEVAGLTLVLAREKGSGPDELTALLRRCGVVRVDVDLLEAGGGTQAIAPVEAFAAAVQIGEKLRESTGQARHADVRLVRHVTQAIVDRIVGGPGFAYRADYYQGARQSPGLAFGQRRHPFGACSDSVWD